MNDRELAKKLMTAAPQMSRGELDEINAHFRAFVFRRSKTRELWTTCCYRHETLPKEYGDEFEDIMRAEHHREVDLVPSSWGPGNTTLKRVGDLFMLHNCPFCGKGVYVKELGRTGRRNNLKEFARVSIIRWYRGALWARSYFIEKRYGPFESSLTARPDFSLHKIYRFKPGEAVCAEKSYWSDTFDYINRLTVTEKPKKLPLQFYEPFSAKSGDYSLYRLIGQDEIGKSPFKYCMYDEYIDEYGSPMRFLAVCCIFPRQVEMLLKMDMANAVKDLVEGRRWNANSFKWEEENPLKSFALDRDEMNKYLATDKNLKALAYYKQFRKKGIVCEISDIEEILKLRLDARREKTVFKLLKEWQVKPQKWSAYIEAAVEESTPHCPGNATRQVDLATIARHWLDYVDAARELAYDLGNPLVRMPKDLIRKHDEATGTVRAALEAENKKRRAAELKKRKRRYEFAYAGLVTIVPKTHAEIIAEGKALKHCVGGYADRHTKGTLTIVFLRHSDRPDVPLATIEMQGKQMVQIHGYKNDIEEKVAPREKYKEFLDTWLSWVNSGSKRDKDGNQKIPRKEEQRQQRKQVGIPA